MRDYICSSILHPICAKTCSKVLTDVPLDPISPNILAWQAG